MVGFGVSTLNTKYVSLIELGKVRFQFFKVERFWRRGVGRRQVSIKLELDGACCCCWWWRRDEFVLSLRLCLARPRSSVQHKVILP